MIACCCLTRFKKKIKSKNFIAFCCTDADDDVVTLPFIKLIRLCASFVLVDSGGGGSAAIY